MLANIFRITTITALVLILTSCGSIQVGKDFDMRIVQSNIERGVSTKTEVTAWVGTPTGIGISMDANNEALDEWSYYFAAGKLSDLSGAKVKILQIRFDKQGIVRSYNWSTSDQ